MSWRHTQAVIEMKLGEPTLCAVLLVLSHHANEMTGICWPSISRLRAGTGLGESTIQRALNRLIEMKLIQRTLGGGKKPNIYTLTFPGVSPVAQTDPPRSGASPPPERDPSPPTAGGECKRKENRTEDAPVRAREKPFPLPDGWQPSEEMIAQARKEYPDVDLEHETRQFIAVNQRDGTLGFRWDAAWRVWIGRAKQFGGKAGGPGAGARGGSDADRLRRLAAQADR